MKSQGEIVRELVKDPSLRVTDIAKQTGYNKGHVSRLRKEATKKEWVSLTDDEIAQGLKESWVTEQAWQSAVWWAEAKLKEKNT